MDAWPRIREQSGTAIVCMALGFRKLWESHREVVFLNALSAIAEIGELMQLTGQKRKWIREGGNIALQNGASAPHSVNAAYQAMGDACNVALSHLETPFGEGLPPQRFKFSEFERP
jgi:hypothetical protein